MLVLLIGSSQGDCLIIPHQLRIVKENDENIITKLYFIETEVTE